MEVADIIGLSILSILLITVSHQIVKLPEIRQHKWAGRMGRTVVSDEYYDYVVKTVTHFCYMKAIVVPICIRSVIEQNRKL